MKGSLVSMETDLDPKQMRDATLEALQDLGRQIATHCVANYPQPLFVHREDISAETVDKEKELILQSIMEKGGDAQNLEIVQKQMDGRINKFFAEKVLMEQPFCLEDDSKFTVKKLIDKKAKELQCDIKVANIVVYNLGEAV